MTPNVKQIIVIFAVSVALVAGLAWWVDNRSNGTPELLLDHDQTFNGPLTPEEQEITNPGITNTMNPTATFRTNRGDITLELFEDKMPITAQNFITLAEEGFYNETKFHRVIQGFMIQGGDPNSKGDNELTYGTGGPGFTIQDEFVSGELLTNTRGTIAMANTGQPNSGGSQWFINLVDNSHLDFDKQPLTSKHPVFGRVTEGMDIVDAIGATATKERDIPVEPVIIESIEITRSN